MKIAEIQKMVMIPEERYDRMLESYDKAVNTTGKLVKEVSAMQAELDRRTIIENEASCLSASVVSWKQWSCWQRFRGGIQ